MSYRLPHVGGETIAHKVCLQLIQDVKTGEYAQSKTLPSENDLAARFGVSRSVIRDVLSDLEREGFLQRMRGIGTVIHRDIVDLRSRLDLKLEYNELIRGMGYEPSVDMIQVRTEQAGEALAQRLQIDPGEAVLVCEKRMLAGETPVIYSIDRLPLRLFADVPYAALDWSQPVFNLLETHLGFDVDTDIAHIQAAMGPSEVRAALAVQPQEALFFIDEIGSYRLSHPIFHSYGYYTNFFDFTMLRKRF